MIEPADATRASFKGTRLSQVLRDMVQPPGNRLERLSDGTYSVRVNDQYRVVFRWDDGAAAAEEVWCGDYHD